MDKIEIRTEKAPLPVGPYSQAVRTGNMLFISGVLPINIETKKLVTSPVTDCAALIFSHLDNILKEAGLTKNNVIKSTIFMKDLAGFADVNKIYSEYFSGCKVMPARSTVEVARLPLDAPVEMEFIAVS
jgi:2-iminobutanoate/2-iminopropanoate deaminase